MWAERHGDEVERAGREIGYAENLTPQSTTSGVGVVIPGLVIVVPPGTRPVAIDWGGCVYSSGAGGMVNLFIMQDGVTLIQRAQFKSQAANDIGEIDKHVRIPASLVSRTFSVQLASLSAGVAANLQGQVAGQPTYLHIRED